LAWRGLCALERKLHVNSTGINRVRFNVEPGCPKIEEIIEPITLPTEASGDSRAQFRTLP
jgi:hypothetical protein